MIALDAKPFVQHKVAFRSAFGSEKECAASECKLLARDFWQAGFRRWLVRDPPLSLLDIVNPHGR